MEEYTNPEAEQELEETGTADEGTGADDSKGDPLDQIDDLEALRHEAKKYRGIATRKKEPTSTTPGEETPYLTKRELYLINEKKAIHDVRKDSEIDQNFEAIKGYYVSRRGKDTPEDIAEDMRDAYILWKARNPQASDGSNDLATIAIARPSGLAPKPQATKTETDPRFQAPSKPESWY